jgi:hypothetical protein
MALSAIMGPTSEETGFIRLRLRYSSCVPISGDPNHDKRTAGSGEWCAWVRRPHDSTQLPQLGHIGAVTHYALDIWLDWMAKEHI